MSGVLKARKRNDSARNNNADLTTVPEDHLSVEIDPRAEICRLRLMCGGVVR
jgi:hypothetical protein